MVKELNKVKRNSFHFLNLIFFIRFEKGILLVKKNYLYFFKSNLIRYKKSSDRDLPLGQYELGKCYLYGRGIPKDEEMGIILLIKAAEQDISDAKEILEKL